VEHYFGSLNKKNFACEAAELKAELNMFPPSSPLAACPLSSRLHAANLMVDGDNRLRVVDHQDARMGPVTTIWFFLLDGDPNAFVAELRAYRLFC